MRTKKASRPALPCALAAGRRDSFHAVACRSARPDRGRVRHQEVAGASDRVVRVAYLGGRGARSVIILTASAGAIDQRADALLQAPTVAVARAPAALEEPATTARVGAAALATSFATLARVAAVAGPATTQPSRGANEPVGAVLSLLEVGGLEDGRPWRGLVHDLVRCRAGLDRRAADARHGDRSRNGGDVEFHLLFPPNGPTRAAPGLFGRADRSASAGVGSLGRYRRRDRASPTFRRHPRNPTRALDEQAAVLAARLVGVAASRRA